MHDALSALINLTDSPTVALRVGDADFLRFLVAYIGVRGRAHTGLGFAACRLGVYAFVQPDQI